MRKNSINKKTKLTSVEKELQKIEHKEQKLLQNAKECTKVPKWKSELENKIPKKVMTGLQKAFSKAFYMIFEKGSVLIEKTYDKDSIEKEFLINDFAVDMKGSRKEIRRMRFAASKSNTWNTMIMTIEGIGLGALGIGLPDIVIWIGVLLRGIYETALKYGFDYESNQEKYFILKMIETAMLSGDKWIISNSKIDQMIVQDTNIIQEDEKEELKKQIENTANVFAEEMLVTKFIQGLPVVGMFGGTANPIYYQKIMRYVQLKYRKRYMLRKKDKN